MPNTQTLGAVGFVPMGDYNQNTYYQKLSLVQYNYASYVAKKPSQSVIPTVSTGWEDYWMLLFEYDIEANPNDAPTEELQKIKVGGTTYNIPQGGGQLYVHKLAFETNDYSYTCYADYISNKSTPYESIGELFDESLEAINKLDNSLAAMQNNDTGEISSVMIQGISMDSMIAIYGPNRTSIRFKSLGDNYILPL